MLPEQFLAFSRPLPEPLCLIDARGQFLAANPAAMKFLSMENETLVGQTLFALSADSKEKVERTLQIWSRSRNLTPGPLKIRTNSDQITICNCNGSLIQPKTIDSPALILLRMESRKQFSKSFRALNEKIALLQKEIIVRQQTEQALAKSKAEFEAMFNSIPDAVTFTNTERQIIMSNPALYEMFGYNERELIGNTTEMFYADKAEFHEQGKRRYRTGPKPAAGAYEIKYRRKDGSTFWSETLGTQVKSSDGDTIGFIGLIRDITERKLTENEIIKHREHLEELVNERTQELKTINKELEAFSYSVSHDLRAPLRGMDGFSKALLDDYSDILDENGKRYISRIRHNAQHMAKLIDDLLELSRISRSDIMRQTVNLSELAKISIDRLKELSPTRNIKVSIVENIKAKSDKTLISIALDNLLNNAWKYTSKTEHAIIEFGSNEVNGEAIYFVKDNGVGFDMQYYEKLFGAFQRLHAVNDFEGTGIGLATVQRIIHRHGGRIWAESEINKGTTLFFTLGLSNKLPLLT